MVSEHFEVAVVGRQPAGLVLAAQLARAGRRVVVVEVAEEPALAAPMADDVLGHVLGVVETQAPHLRAAHEAMGLGGRLGRAGGRPPAAGHVQAIFARGRIELAGAPAGPAAEPAPREAPGGEAAPPLAAELAAEFDEQEGQTLAWTAALADEDGALADLLARVPNGPPVGTWRRWRSRRLEAELAKWRRPASPPTARLASPAAAAAAARLWAAVLPFAVGCEAGAATRLQAARLWGRLLAGGSLAAELAGASALATDFLAGAERAGAQVVRDQPLVRLLGGRQRLDGCELAGRRGRVGADFFVLNVAANIRALAASPAAAARLERAFAAARAPAGAVAGYEMWVPHAAVPAPLAPIALLLNGRAARGATPPDPPLCLRRLREANGAVRFRIDCPLASPADADARAAALAHILPRLRRLLPALPRPAPPGDWATDSSPLWPWAAADGWGTLQLRQQATPFANLVDGRADVAAGLGLESAHLLAQLTAAALARAAGGAWRQEPR